MAANTYFDSHPLSAEEQQQQHLLSQSHSHPSPGMPSGRSSGNSSPLKPLHLVNDGDSRHHHEHRRSLVDFDEIQKTHKEDARLKSRIRKLRVVSRVLAFLISIAVFVPISITLQKFLSTQNVYRDVTKPDGTVQSRTAWAKDSKTWPTWMYFLIAGISVLLNFIIIFSYKFGVEKANKAATIATTFTWITVLGNLIVWTVAATLYRTEKDKNGKSNDLWGWTCSPAAKAIQKEFSEEVDFDRFCNVQSVSFYVGVVQVGAALLTVVTYIFVLFRRRSKKKLKKQGNIISQWPSNY